MPNCVVCQNPFELRRDDQVTCSKPCSKNRYTPYMQVLTIICKQCKEPFTGREDRVFCKATCRVAWYEANKPRTPVPPPAQTERRSCKFTPICACGKTVNILASSRCSTCVRRSRPKIRLRYPTKIVSCASQAIYRCYNETCTQYKDYGGRGITVHTPWLDDRQLFMAYLCTLPGWNDENLEIDRIDVDGNYEPGNLRFVTRKINRSNQRRTK